MKLLLVLFLALLSVAFCRMDISKSSDPLACIINSFSYTFPEINVDIDGKTLTISDLTCNNMDIASIPSEYKPPTTLAMGAKGLKAGCKGNYKYGILHQTVAIDLETDIMLDVFVQKVDNFPVFTNFSTCNVTKFDIKIDFSSSILNAFAPIIASMIQKQIYNSICVTLNTAYSTKVTDALVNKIDPRIMEVSASEPSPYPEYDRHYMDWGNSTYSEIRDVLETVRTTADLPSFLKCMADSRPAEVVKSVLQVEEEEGWTSWKPVEDIVVDGFLKEPIVIAPGFSIEILSTRLKGLDTLQDLQILEPYNESKVVLRTLTNFESLYVQVKAEIQLNATAISPNCDFYREEVEFTFAVSNSVLTLDLALAVDEHLLKSFFMDQLGTFPCWLSTIAELSLPNVDLTLNLTDISIRQIRGDSGQLEKDLTALLDNVLQFLFAPEAFKETTEMIISGVMQGPLRDYVNTFFADKIAESQHNEPCLTHYPYDDVVDYLQWPSNDIILTLDKIINKKIGAEGLNEIMTCLTDGTGMLSIFTRFLEIDLKGLNSFYGLEILAPTVDDPDKVYNLGSYIGAGYCPDGSDADTCNPLAIAVKLNPSTFIPALLAPSTAGGVFDDMHFGPYKGLVLNHRNLLNLPNRTMNFALTMENVELSTSTLLKVDKDKLLELNFKQLPTTGCKASTIDNLVFEDVAINVSKADMLFHDGTYDRNITSILQRLLNFITQPSVIDGKNADIANELYVAGPTCMNGGVNPLIGGDDITGGGDHSDDWKWEMLLLVVGCTASLAGLLMAYHHWGTAKEANTCFGYDPAEVEEIDGKEVIPRRSEHGDPRSLWERWSVKDTLLFHHEIPLWVRIGIPMAVIGNWVLFIDSNNRPDAVSVMVTINAPDKVYDLGSMFDFGLTSTVTDMWDAEVYTLAVLIAFFSGAWPYVKLAVMLLSWILPPGLLSLERRETFLVVLDALGKWSLVDFFVMVLFLCAFYMDLVLAPGLEVLVTVKPKWGFYSFLLATMISLGLGHTIVACHRLVTEPKVPTLSPDMDPKESLSSLTYEVTLEEYEEVEPLSRDVDIHDMNSQLSGIPGMRRPMKRVMHVTMTKWGKAFVVGCLLLSAIFICMGTWFLTMGFQFKGLVGLMLGEDAENDYSFIDVGVAIPKHSGIPNDFAIRWMQASYFVFGMAMPLSLLIVLGVLWMIPLSLDRQRQLFVLSEVLNAWSTLDVFCIAIAASLLEIRQFAAFIVGDACDGINVILGKYMDEKLDGDDKCFDVVAVLLSVSRCAFHF